MGKLAYVSVPMGEAENRSSTAPTTPSECGSTVPASEPSPSLPGATLSSSPTPKKADPTSAVAEVQTYGSIEVPRAESNDKGPLRERRGALLLLISVLAVLLVIGGLLLLHGLQAVWGPVAIEYGSKAGHLEELREPSAVSSINGLLETSLEVVPTYYQGRVSYMTRSYNGTIPGPTLRVRPGDTLKIKLVNRLGPNLSGPERERDNFFHSPNTTNLHVHGLHVSPSGKADNVFRACVPGEEIEYEYVLPLSHPSGLFHYHPHFHGSATLQVGGGMEGAIIVEDREELLPVALSAMKERLLVVQIINVGVGTLRNYLNVHRISHSTMDLKERLPPEEEKQQGKIVDEKETRRREERRMNFLYYAIVNGQDQPKMTMKPGEFQRLRLLNAGDNDILEIYIDETEVGRGRDFESSLFSSPRDFTSSCEMVVLARDGVYLREPRRKGIVVVAPGSRADFAVRCNESGIFSLSSKRFSSLDSYMGLGSDVYSGRLAFLVIEGEKKEMQYPFSLPPTGRDNLTHLERGKVDSFFRFEWFHGGHVVIDGANYTAYGVNGVAYNGTPIYTSRLNAVNEWDLVNLKKGEGEQDTNHPWHIHVNHVQIVSVSHGEGVDYDVGDWRDTITLPTPGNTTVRFVNRDFIGEHLAHCHIVAHCDLGMKAKIAIVP